MIRTLFWWAPSVVFICLIKGLYTFTVLAIFPIVCKRISMRQNGKIRQFKYCKCFMKPTLKILLARFLTKTLFVETLAFFIFFIYLSRLRGPFPLQKRCYERMLCSSGWSFFSFWRNSKTTVWWRISANTNRGKISTIWKRLPAKLNLFNLRHLRYK